MVRVQSGYRNGLRAAAGGFDVCRSGVGDAELVAVTGGVTAAPYAPSALSGTESCCGGDAHRVHRLGRWCGRPDGVSGLWSDRPVVLVEGAGAGRQAAEGPVVGAAGEVVLVKDLRR